MKHLIITGFDPFGGETVNPSWEAVRRLPDIVGDYRLTKLQIPTVFAVAAETVLTAAAADAPDVILCVGQAGGRDAVTPERIAVNMASARIPDNAGNQPVESPILPGAPDGIIEKLEDNIFWMDSVTMQLMDGGDLGAEEIIKNVLKDMEYDLVEETPVEYRCNCSRSRMERALITLGQEELTRMIQDEQEGAELTCHFCKKTEKFTQHDLIRLLNHATRG
jgi:redox-regulated HSP33 family molecular chaperone